MTFIAFEGIDGCGKSTLLQAVAERLRARGSDPLCVREPGSTPLGERVRKALLDPATGDLTAWTEVCLFTACRAEMVATQIRPALAAGRDVLLDRYFYSTLAYQAYGAGADIETTRALQLAAVGGLLPDVVVMPDISVEEAARRRQSADDRMEAKGAAFLERVRRGFLAQAKADPSRWRVLDGARTPEVVADLGWRAIEDPGAVM
ncbi:MAG: dTMP kinase [Deltaproteobacteria bacterium]|nr:dTMP kinase [Deltaproteobacteria bacterium]